MIMNSKKMAQQAAKSLAQEPVEILETAKNQLTGAESVQQPENESVSQPGDRGLAESKQRQEADSLKSARRVEALNRELSDIQKQDIFKDLQNRISEGENIPLEDYSELSMEQKQVLKAQMEAVRAQNAVSVGEETLVEPTPKHGRQFGITRKQEVKRQQTHIEKPVPPSG